MKTNPQAFKRSLKRQISILQYNLRAVTQLPPNAALFHHNDDTWTVKCAVMGLGDNIALPGIEINADSKTMPYFETPGEAIAQFLPLYNAFWQKEADSP